MFLHDLIIKNMLNSKVLPSVDFSITAYQIAYFMKEYVRLSNTIGSAKHAEQIYNAKLAALSLVKYKKDNNLKIGEGFVYLISNPAWPNIYKVGMTTSPKDRLKQYQTYSPFRDFKLHHWSFWFDKRQGEKFIRQLSDSISHEWVNIESKELQKHLSRVNTLTDINSVLKYL
ncbi:hypothetical protein U7154_000003 [Kononvirus KKP3711]|uniref:GIY-YIG domain-containing protein n=1 Tax=Enterobacter phage KKP_3711 TaxID=3109398 RepID=A0AAX4Q5L9_9CAUD